MRSTGLSPEFVDIIGGINNSQFFSSTHQKTLTIKGIKILDEGSVIGHIHDDEYAELLFQEYLYYQQTSGNGGVE